MAVEKKLSAKTLKKVYNRHYQLLGCFNYERQMSTGYAWTMMPALRELYADNPEEMKKGVKRHLEFFNCATTPSPFIVGITCAMEEQNASAEPGEYDASAITSVKAALMGPLAGIGDTVTQSLVKTIFLSIGCSLALSGNVLGPILFFVGMSAYALGLSYFLYFQGYNSGKTSVTKILRSGIVKSVSEALGALGMMVLGAMVAANIGVTTPLSFTVGGSEIVLQNILNSILPKMLPLLIFFGTYRLVVKGKKATTIIIGMFVVGILGSVLHLLG